MFGNSRKIRDDHLMVVKEERGGVVGGGGVWVGDTFNSANHSGSNILYCFLFSMVKMKCSLLTIYCSLNFLSTLNFFSSFVSSSLLFLSD